MDLNLLFLLHVKTVPLFRTFYYFINLLNIFCLLLSFSIIHNRFDIPYQLEAGIFGYKLCSHVQPFYFQ